MSTFRQTSCGAAYTLAVSTAPVSFVASNFGAPLVPYVRIQVQKDAVYVTYDGTVPSSTNGELVVPGSAAYLLRKDILAMRFLRVTTDAAVFAQPCDLISPVNDLS